MDCVLSNNASLKVCCLSNQKNHVEMEFLEGITHVLFILSSSRASKVPWTPRTHCVLRDACWIPTWTSKWLNNWMNMWKTFFSHRKNTITVQFSLVHKTPPLLVCTSSALPATWSWSGTTAQRKFYLLFRSSSSENWEVSAGPRNEEDDGVK